MNLHFIEIQKFTQWWLWLILLAITFIPLYGLYVQIIKGGQFGSKPLSSTGLIFFLCFMLLMLIFFWLMKLTTEIDKDGISFNYFPFTSRVVSWSEVESAEVVDYGFVGGWGVRRGSKHGTVYNISGKMGLALRLKNGDKFCIGTQKEQELQKLIKSLRD